MNFYQKLVLLLFYSFFIYSLNSQTLTQTVKGQVVDSQTAYPISGVHVVLLNNPLKLGVITGFDGRFSLENVPVGRASFGFSAIGHEDFAVREIIIGSAKEIEIIIPLIEDITKLDAVIIPSKKDKINAVNKSAFVSVKSFNVEETKRYPVSINDPARMALNYAGVTNSDDGTNEIIIRGNAPNLLLWKIEGVEVSDPNHFVQEGTHTGVISLLSSNMLAKSDFFTGAFPAEYGNAISGVFDINLRNGNNKKREYTFQFGIIGTSIAFEGPFKKNEASSYLLNYRYSSISYLNDIIDVTNGNIPKFQDLSFKINIPLSNKTNLSIWEIGGLSENRSKIVSRNRKENNKFDSNSLLTGIRLSHFFNDKTKITSQISFAGNTNTYTQENRYSSLTNKNKYEFANNAFRFNTDLIKKYNANTDIKTGVILSKLYGGYLYSTQENGVELNTSNTREKGQLLQGFGQLNYRFNSKLKLSTGLHITHFSINNNTVIEPRLSLSYKIKPKHTLSFGYGLHSRRMPVLQYFTEIVDADNVINRPNKNIHLMQSAQYIVGYDWQIINNGHLKLEAYYQHLNHVAVVKDIQNTNSVVNGNLIYAELLDNSTAENMGVEITFEKFFSKQYFFLITASLFDAKYKASNGIWYNSRFNYNYVYNIIGGKEFTLGKKKNNTLGISAKFLANGGKRNTPVDIEYYEETGWSKIKQTLRNTIQYDTYFRIDSSIYYRMNRKKTAHVFSLDIQNLTNHKNISAQFFNPSTGELITYYQLRLLPLINYKIEF